LLGEIFGGAELLPSRTDPKRGTSRVRLALSMIPPKNAELPFIIKFLSNIKLRNAGASPRTPNHPHTPKQGGSFIK